MEKKFDINKDGYSVRCLCYYDKDPKDVTDIVIATYGFGGVKENSAIKKFSEKLTSKHKNFEVVTFDWPCHGADARNRMILSEFLKYYQMVVEYAKEERGAERIYAYGTSLGGYMTLLYLNKLGNPFTKIALRVPAIHMYENFAGRLTDDDWAKIKKKKDVNVGFKRKINLSQDFLDELEENNVSDKDYLDFADDMMIIAGGKDQYTSVEDITKFCEDNVIEYEVVENADHPFTDPNLMDYAISKIIKFFGA
ncbi:MAG: alpha/beta hydrolase [Lachnospiraceae bacterium]|uniref:Prolyl oligopeptidase family serine peptidase n=1 Tax=Candidatus Weimeria bifida TaxID=2599074 RepID=A0A6N7IX48_9FIRM|nr:prolyl oligopeptidase family serine peptidase [Candidatus Weimeria bifida]RRF97213.1 MAG: alpha/beta hydrolase [Lachnospiraceae bacterium]